ncbi:MAG: hypothetical protein ACI865_001268 [Flavobacteriaceae bacterium]|jgi:hypothetical protein
MNLVILRTDIGSKSRVQQMRPALDNHRSIHRWSIDLEDIDNVLRIEAADSLNENEVIKLIDSYGFYGEELED